ncbi:NAD(P)-dependent oxidoreductase [Polycladidibacter stylochi]|uniref:NAD(P)-dependent oxidoreductase n=1 Tax=Polycladidibacter stylochi TaxID=1807766 RepID=UPI00082F1156|nr:NAD(P)-dependent oxidoreductase [Pseudovibrio stylochi]
MKRILVTPRSMTQSVPPALRKLEDEGFELVIPTPGKIPSEAELIAAVPDCWGWIAGVEPVSPKVIHAAKSLQVISRNGVGVDNLPIKLLEENNIRVERAVGSNANGVAELTLALMLAALRHIPASDRGIRDGAWPRIRGCEIAGSTVAVLGLGAIGKLVAQKLLKLNARVIGYDPYSDGEELKQFGTFEQYDQIEPILRECDALSLHMPLPENAQPVLDAKVLQQLKPGAVIVNTARAGLVDQNELLKAMNQARVAAYATDVFDTEPPQPSELLAHERCILTSHIGGFTAQSVERVTQVSVDNLLKDCKV